MRRRDFSQNRLSCTDPKLLNGSYITFLSLYIIINLSVVLLGMCNAYDLNGKEKCHCHNLSYTEWLPRCPLFIMSCLMGTTMISELKDLRSQRVFLTLQTLRQEISFYIGQVMFSYCYFFLRQLNIFTGSVREHHAGSQPCCDHQRWHV